MVGRKKNIKMEQAPPAAADPNVVLIRELQNISRSVASSGIKESIKQFNGDRKDYKEWIKSVEKYCKLMELPEDRSRQIAFWTATGEVSNYIHRYLSDHPQGTWGQMKGDLGLRFAEVTDRGHARAVMRTLKQRPQESPQIFAERLLTAGEDAFDGVDRGENNALLPAIERQLIDYFVDGLRDVMLKKKLMREDPQTLAEAAEIAGREQNLLKRFELRLGGKSERQDKKDLYGREVTPMEVDANRVEERCFKCGKRGHQARFCRTQNIQAIQGDMNCWFCGKPGHFKRECLKRKQGAFRSGKGN